MATAPSAVEAGGLARLPLATKGAEFWVTRSSAVAQPAFGPASIWTNHVAQGAWEAGEPAPPPDVPAICCAVRNKLSGSDVLHLRVHFWLLWGVATHPACHPGISFGVLLPLACL